LADGRHFGSDHQRSRYHVIGGQNQAGRYRRWGECDQRFWANGRCCCRRFRLHDSADCERDGIDLRAIRHAARWLTLVPRPMTLHAYQGGSWKGSAPYAYNAGTWKLATSISAYESGTWKTVAQILSAVSVTGSTAVANA